MRRGSESRQPPCRDGKPNRDSDPYRDRQPHRDKVAPDRGNASTDVVTPWDAPSQAAQNHTNMHTQGGEHGESFKANYKTPRTPDPPGLGRAQEIPTFHKERTPMGPFTSVGHLLLALRKVHDATAPRTTLLLA
ncbi:hypothetical protein Taro_002616 [Colocasia esculenta]|uniref:Uncharacterized protein n=1 Tax=Colocasia esculenta TaxID=4460 RepID=A0A843TJK1_COLES|nr:hypothetical protein [Colocasia esculenta]